jgi:peptidoglycan LD-endopeptidase LytH
MALSRLLMLHSKDFKPMFEPDLNNSNTCFMDFSSGNATLAEIDLLNTRMLNDYVFGLLEKNNKDYGYGGYLEDREVYRRSSLFAVQGESARSIHLGIDVWTQPGKAVYIPLQGKVHSFQDNKSFGDYGPTIIMEHNLDGFEFFTLYGHLSSESLKNLHHGKAFAAGELLCSVGQSFENGDWPPHLHFQVIADMMDKKGDFPGVCTKAEVTMFKRLCPDPVAFFSGLK